MKRCVFIVFILQAFALFSCTDITGKLKLVEGNFYFSRGMINEAIGAYLDAVNHPSAAAYANFSLGTTYLALEQTDAALERFAVAEKALSSIEEHKKLLYAIRYNRAVAYFENEDFSEAAAAFRGALEVDSTARDAKRNMELSLLSFYRKQQSSTIEKSGGGGAGSGKNERDDILFDYIRQRESEKWKSWEWSGEKEESGPDY
ncbi:MAG: tetratricopeptide repeat protein [Spirochaetaceae bacterium]|jgi:Ca-activated chloride channel family protein|nr:tetratricopeptide repeat protein [Spirochaetaceae bacterium]GMO26728.1 MAG: hypothetical protein Pg6A_14090 [Termitinemataceae bacterium]